LGEEPSIQQRESRCVGEVRVFLVSPGVLCMLVDADAQTSIGRRAPRRAVRAVRSRLGEAKTLSESHEVSYLVTSFLETSLSWQQGLNSKQAPLIAARTQTQVLAGQLLKALFPVFERCRYLSVPYESAAQIETFPTMAVGH
jgi:hypothetical protein